MHSPSSSIFILNIPACRSVLSADYDLTPTRSLNGSSPFSECDQVFQMLRLELREPVHRLAHDHRFVIRAPALRQKLGIGICGFAGRGISVEFLFFTIPAL